MIMVVTGYVPIPGHPRSEEEYHRLAEPLHMLGTRAADDRGDKKIG